jgi:Fic family protein
MKDIPLGSRVLKGVHAALMPHESGYRSDQVYIKNITSDEIVYRPPDANEIEDLIEDLEKFIHDDSRDIDPIIRTIMTHYQFEAIHPFSDGNGRTGRILMVLCLTYYELLDLPV